MSNNTPSSRSHRRALLVLALAVVLSAAVLATTACGSNPATPSTESSTSGATTQPSTTTEPSTTDGSTSAGEPAVQKGEPFSPVDKLVIKDTVKGTGKTAKAGDQVTVDYTGWLPDGTQFDSSIGKQPFSFTIGAGQVIEGWDKGVAGMKVGGTRILIVPSSMGYGPTGYPPVIPADSSLKFQVKLLGIGG